MALVGLSEAARLTGRNQTTIHRAMRTGRLSYTGEAGARRVDTAELDRVFKINGAIPQAMANEVQGHVTPVREIELLNRLLDDREATIRDLRARLDTETEERRRVQAQLIGLLAPGPEIKQPAPPPTVSWPRRVWRWARSRA